MDETLRDATADRGERQTVSGADLLDVGRRLAEAGVQLALAETGTAGEIDRLLRGTAEGAAVVTKAQLHGSPAELAAALRVSAAKVDAFGAISAMVAAEAAAELIDTYEGGWGLAVLLPDGNLPEGAGVQNLETIRSDGFIALATPSRTIVQPCVVSDAVQLALLLLGQEARRQRKRS